MTEVALIQSPGELAALPEEQRGEIITRALEESKAWLEVAVRGTDPYEIEECKAYWATLAEMTRQKNMSEEIQMDAQIMVFRAMRALGVVAEHRVEAGLDRKPSERDSAGNQYQSGAALHESSTKSSLRERTPTTSEYVDTRDMTIGVDDEVFEQALQKSRDEGNVSRRNVARNARELSGRDECEVPTFIAEVGEPTCVPVVFREAMLEKIHAWVAEISKLIPHLSLHERDVLLKEIHRLEHDLHNIPAPVFEEEQ